MSQVIAERLAAADRFTARRGTGLRRLLASWAALGVTLSGATQLRPRGLPIGPAEVILGCWLCFVLFLWLRGAPVASSRVSVAMALYWSSALAVLGFGTLAAIQTGQFDVTSASHDALAFVYLAILTTTLPLKLLDDDGYQFHWHFARMTFFFHVLAAGLLFGLALKLSTLGPIRFWYSWRFRGWSENPNQMALAMAAMPFLGWWLLRRTSGRLGKVACGFGIALSVVVGLASYSDGLRLAWATSLGAIGSLLFYRVTMHGRSRWLHISHAIIPAVLVIVAVSYGDVVLDYAEQVADRIYAEGHQGEKRFTLWSHGLQAIAASPVVGFGPGSFSGINGPFEGMEAHNSFIDWTASTGLAGLLIYLMLLAWTTWRGLRSGDPMLVGMLVAVVMPSVFGYLLRQPDFWTVVALVLILSERAIKIRERQAAGPLVPEPGGHARRLTLRPAAHLQHSPR
jgi:O-antigen ligase